MKIISFKAENFKRLVCVEITPKGNVIKLTGKNAEGKSSILDAIWCACGGADVIPDKPIRAGQDHAEIILDFGELKITRRFTLKGSSLTVENAEGAIFRSPQKVIDELIGKLSFDPMHFMHMPDKDQFETLATHAGVDFTIVDAERKELFEERTIVNRQGKAKRAEVDAAALVLDDKAPDEEVSVSALAEELQNANDNNTEIKQITNTVFQFSNNIENENQKIIELKKNIVQHETNMKMMLDAKSSSEEDLKKMVNIDADEIKKKIDAAEETNKAVRTKKEYYVKHEALETLLADSLALTTKIKACDAEREKMIAESELPVAGLSFGDDAVLLNEIPIKQTSSAEQLTISVAVAMAMNPKLKVIRVQDGSLLDSVSMKLIEDAAKAKDFQFWIEQVDESGVVGVVIEDGQVKSDNQ